MDVPADETPFIALIDDCLHSARLLMRTLQAQGAPDVRHFGTASAGETALADMLSSATLTWPDMVVVDLKSHSQANLDFIGRNQALLRQRGIPIAVMTQPTGRAGRQILHEAGVSAVFFRQPERAAYRQEAAALVHFWARSPRLDTVGM